MYEYTACYLYVIFAQYLHIHVLYIRQIDYKESISTIDFREKHSSGVCFNTWSVGIQRFTQGRREGWW